MPFSHISCEQLIELRRKDPDSVTLVDIRDPASFAQGHIEGAIHITNDNVAEFITNSDSNKPVVVCCYHGNSSQGAADYFNAQGFAESYSLDGGYEYWRTLPLDT